MADISKQIISIVKQNAFLASSTIQLMKDPARGLYYPTTHLNLQVYDLSKLLEMIDVCRSDIEAWMDSISSYPARGYNRRLGIEGCVRGMREHVNFLLDYGAELQKVHDRVSINAAIMLEHVRRFDGRPTMSGLPGEQLVTRGSSSRYNDNRSAHVTLVPRPWQEVN